MKKNTILLLLLVISFRGFSNPALITIHLPGKAKIILTYQRLLTKPVYVAFINTLAIDTVISRPLDLPKYQLLSYDVSVFDGKDVEIIEQSFYLHNGDTAVFKIKEDYKLQAQNPKVLILEHFLNLFNPFTRSGNDIVKAASADFYTYLQTAQNVCDGNRSKLDAMYGRGEINVELKQLLELTIELDYFQRCFTVITDNIVETHMQKFETLSKDLERIRPALEVLNGKHLLFLYHDYIRYQLLKAGKPADLNNSFDLAIHSGWSKSLIIAYLAEKLEAFQNKSPELLKTNFEKLKTFSGSANQSTTDSLYKILFPHLTRSDQIKLLVPTGESTSLKKVLLQNKGKLIIIDFWASWCTPCREAFPDLNKMKAKFRNEKVAFVGLSLDADNRILDWMNALKKEKLFDSKNQFKLSDTKKSPLFDNITINSIPRYIIINSSGKVINSDFYGPGDNFFEVKLRSYLLNKTDYL